MDGLNHHALILTLEILLRCCEHIFNFLKFHDPRPSFVSFNSKVLFIAHKLVHLLRDDTRVMPTHE